MTIFKVFVIPGWVTTDFFSTILPIWNFVGGYVGVGGGVGMWVGFGGVGIVVGEAGLMGGFDVSGWIQPVKNTRAIHKRVMTNILSI